MMRRLLTKKSPNSEKIKFNHLKGQCKQAITTLLLLHKKHRTHHCVLIIGQPESGKSTLCATSSTLLFSSQNNETTNEFAFEIYLQHQTLFLHIPQNFFLFSENRLQHAAWHFLATRLRQQRTHILLSRCIICIDLHDFLTRSKVSNDTRLSQIAFALQTVANGLRVHLDTTLFFTKADLIPGFNEFFDHQNKEFLEQPWGISLENHTPDGLTAECEQLIKTLNQNLLWRMHHEINPEHLHLIKTFPLVMETVKQKFIEILPGFLAQWSQHKFLTPTQLQLVSCRQFRELKDVSHAASNKEKNNPRENHKHFFTKHALEIICQHNASHATFPIDKIIRVTFVALCSLLLIAFIAYISSQFSEHVTLIHTINQTLESGNDFAKQPSQSIKLNQVSNELEKINASLSTLDKNQQSLVVGRYIFTHDTRLEAQLNNLSQRILAQQWLPLINQRLEDYIHTHLSTEPANAYIAFDIYLMLSQPTIPLNAYFIDTHLSDLLGSSNEIIKKIPSNLPKSTVVKNEKSVGFIKNCRAFFLGLPTSKLAYILLYSDLNTHESLNLSAALDNKHPPALEIENTYALIPEIYTRKSFKSTYETRLPEIAQQVLNGNVVLGQRFVQDMSEDALLPQLQKEYIKLYSDAWEQAIKHASLIQTQTLEDLSAQLDHLASSNSPILSLLTLSQNNTSITEVENSSAFLKAFNNTLTPQSTPENSALFHSFMFMKKLGDQLQKIQTSADKKSATCEQMQLEHIATSENPTDAQQLRYLATQLPEPIQTWLTQIVDEYYVLLKKNSAACQ